MGAYQGPQTPPGESYVSLTRAPATHIITDQIPAPTELYVTDDSFLRVTLTALVVITGVNVVTRLLTASDGKISTGEFLLQIASGPGQATQDIKLQEGFLLSATAVAAAGPLVRGTAFVTMTIMRGSGADVKAERVILGDYLAFGQAAGFPGGAITQSTEGKGAEFDIVTTFSPGSELNFSVPGFTRWNVHAIQATFTASAVVATRIPALVISSALGTVATIPITGSGITAGQAFTLTYMVGGPQPVLNNGVYGAHLPDPLLLENGGSVATVTAGRQGGDVYSNVSIHGEQWVNG